MEATISYDDSGVSYGFWNITRDPSARNVVWQPGRQFVDVNLDPNTTYCYRVKARDESTRQNETGWSVIACATTPIPTDTLPPIPNPAQWDPVQDANGFDGTPRQIYGGGGTLDYFVTMTAVVATDVAPAGVAPSGVEYFFYCIEEPSVGPPAGFSSGWQSQPAFAAPWTYTVPIGGKHVVTTWYVIVRDQSPGRNRTAHSNELRAIPYP
jgi:hypothetical protein